MSREPLSATRLSYADAASRLRSGSGDCEEATGLRMGRTVGSIGGRLSIFPMMGFSWPLIGATGTNLRSRHRSSIRRCSLVLNTCCGRESKFRKVHSNDARCRKLG